MAPTTIKDTQVKVLVQEITQVDIDAKSLIQNIRDNTYSTKKLDELNKEVKEKLQILRCKIDTLERLAVEQDRQTDVNSVLNTASTYRKQLSSTQISLRKANLICKSAIDKREREALMRTREDAANHTEIRKRAGTNKEALTKTSSKITDNLLAISRTMANNVNMSESTLGSLAASSDTVSQTHEEFKNMSGVIHTSRRLLTKYNRRELTDKLLILLAVAFFFATVLYVVKKRIFSSEVS